MKTATAVLLGLICSIAASAYTLVFRNGQRLEIPDEFILTRTTLTYEISPGFQKTILVSLINIAATERANKEPWGGFFKHRQQQASVDPQSSQSSAPPSQAVRTVTNSDLAAIRQRRIESEIAYEKRRSQLSLPTVAESRRRQAEEEKDFREQLRARAFADKQEERYWRTRARELRTEIAMLDNQINYVRGRLNELNESSAFRGSWTSTYPLYDPWGRYPNSSRRGNRPRIILGPQYPYGYPNPYPYGYPDPYGYPQYPYGYPNGPYNDAQESAMRERDDLTNRLNDLLVKRTGVATQWQVLEDEARDAKVPQVWLEP